MQDALLERIEKFRTRHGMAPSEFGKLSVNSTNLLSEVTKGRKLGGPIMAKISHFMDAYDETQSIADMAALELVRRCGFVLVEADGLPRLETDSQISPKAFARLVEDGLLAPWGRCDVRRCLADLPSG